MRTDETDVNKLICVLNCHYQTVLIPFDIEDNPIVGDEANVTINSFNIIGRFPLSLFNISKPGFQADAGIWMALPKFSEFLARDDTHGEIIPSYRNGSKWREWWGDKVRSESVIGEEGVQQGVGLPIKPAVGLGGLGQGEALGDEAVGG